MAQTAGAGSGRRQAAVWVGVAVMGVLAALVGRVLVVHRTFDTFPPTPLNCSRVQLPVGGGAEDIVIDHEWGVAFLSVCNFQANFFHSGTWNAGGLFFYNLTQPKLPGAIVPCRLIDFPSEYDFTCPHGIGLLRPASTDQDRYLFVIAHAKRSGPVRHSVHKFAISPDAPGELRYVETFESSEHLISPNDVMPVGERAFFVTNDHTGRSEAAMLLQDLQVLPTNLFPTNVVYFDGSRWQVAVDGLFTANGINTSPDRSLLYVADAGRGTVLTYNLTAIHQQQGEAALSQHLELVDSIALHTMVDNIDVDKEGTLWVGAQPKFLLVICHTIDPAAYRAMAQVLRVRPDGKAGGADRVEQVYLNHGDEIALSSVGAHWHPRFSSSNLSRKDENVEGHLLIGAVVDNWILHCRV